MNPDQARALFEVGKFGQLASNFNADALEDYLKQPVIEQPLEELCRETIKFVRAVRKIQELPDAYTIS